VCLSFFSPKSNFHRVRSYSQLARVVPDHFPRLPASAWRFFSSEFYFEAARRFPGTRRMDLTCTFFLSPPPESSIPQEYPLPNKNRPGPFKHRGLTFISPTRTDFTLRMLIFIFSKRPVAQRTISPFSCFPFISAFFISERTEPPATLIFGPSISLPHLESTVLLFRS